MQDGSIWCATIGKFVNIAAAVRINATNHPTWRATLHHFTYRAVDYWPDADMHEIETRYPEYFHRSFRQRFGGLLIVLATILYGFYAVWFFDLPKLIAEAHWERFGIYMSQWISYDVQPEFRIQDDGTIQTRYPRFSPLGDDPHPDWLKTNTDGSITVLVGGSGRTVTVSKSQTTIVAHDEMDAGSTRHLR